MKKRGFTLAEVLITLGIIGVVAALTAPALIMSSRNEANAAKLSVTVSNLENALTTAIVQENVDDLFHTRMWEGINGDVGNGGNLRNAFVGNLGRYIVISSSGESSGFYERGVAAENRTNSWKGLSANGADTGTAFAFGNNFLYTTFKSGAVVFWNLRHTDTTEETQETMRAAGGSLMNEAAQIFIDVNGSSAPNTIGRDVFAFILGENGILYPMGGNDASVFRHVFNGVGDSGTWDEAGSYSCLDNQIGQQGAGGLGCTARVIEEGYKINY